MVPFSAYQDLVRELASLKRDGFVKPDEYPQTVPVTDPLPAPVRKALTDLALVPETERVLTREALNMLAAGMSPEDVAARISQGEEAEL